MQCPTDGTTLTMSERSGIEIDYCPQCRGIWLDRGELDKILERAEQQAPAAPQAQQGEPAYGQQAPQAPYGQQPPAPYGQQAHQQQPYGQPQWDQRQGDHRPGDHRHGSSGGLGAVADKLLGEVQKRAQGDRRYDDRRYDDRYDPRYDQRRRSKGGWLGDILG